MELYGNNFLGISGAMEKIFLGLKRELKINVIEVILYVHNVRA